MHRRYPPAATSPRSFLAAMVIAVMCSIGTATARAGFGDLGGRFDFVYGDGSGMPTDVPTSTGQSLSNDGKLVKLFGSMGPIDGARFENSFVFYFSGIYDGSINAGDKYTADLDFTVTVTGGDATWNYWSELWSIDGFEGQRLSAGGAVPASGRVSGVHLESQPFTTDNPEAGGQFQGYLNLQWFNHSPTDTLTLTIPQNSIDIAFTPVPEPVAAPLALAVFAALKLRRTPTAARRATRLR